MSFKIFKERLERKRNPIDDAPIVSSDIVYPEDYEQVINVPNAFESEEIDIEKLSKKQLDEYALEYGIELDRRQSKENMITEFYQKLEEKK